MVLVTRSFFFLLASGYFAYGWMMQVGVDQGYAPIQPIHYSHKIHAGANKIECKYCHSSATKVSKHSGIPSLNVCMNCHKSIYEYTGTAGETPSAKKIWQTDILTNSIPVKSKNCMQSRRLGRGEPKIYGGNKTSGVGSYYTTYRTLLISTTRNTFPLLGKIECQTCHGPVEEMEIMYQYCAINDGMVYQLS